MNAMRCEACGYGLDGLEEEACCPECGRGVKSSLPGARRGTPWQRAPGLFSLVRTGVGVLVAPDRTFAEVRMQARGWRGLLAANLMVASFLVVDPWVGVFIGDPARNVDVDHWGVGLALRAGMLLVETAAGALVLLAFTWLIGAGLRAASVPPVNVRQVLAHASAAWIGAGVFSLAGMALHYSVHRFGGEGARVLMGRTFTLGVLSRDPISVGMASGVGLVLLGYALGVALLAARVRAGFNACRYSNSYINE